MKGYRCVSSEENSDIQFIVERCEVVNASLYNWLKVCGQESFSIQIRLFDLKELSVNLEGWRKALSSSALSPGDRSTLSAKVEENREIVTSFEIFCKEADALKGIFSSKLFDCFLILIHFLRVGANENRCGIIG